MTNSTISKGFIAAGLMNTVGLLIFSKGFTNEVIPATDPNVMSYFGLIMITVWGLGYIAVAKTFMKVKWLIGVFVIEKLAYVIAYIIWFSNHQLSDVYDQDLLAGIFYTLYGWNDFIFMIFFAYVFFKIKPSPETPVR
ncbi:hypothetical protein SAMN05192588_1322 [Nonlabens sp. Hel1_33_55]|uniref:hypothetical protein n=1 Tax=Nonlabens sp. Hel1_33_55 TaxID=1336802 RepID=UPI000875C0F3|nr:hypothetical protein [Nonlabens sp. Hel1_33_55]SCY13592.1 hypothetical protein SAMN05192588_1322 [Nonlabens sp. Hel1_33_55]